MVRSLIAALLRRARPEGARVTQAVPRFVPAVQTLEVREVPAVLGLFAATDEAPAASGESGYDTTSAKVTLSDVLVSAYSVASADGGSDATDAKVTVQDFSFTKKVDKASPTL
jgi:hypothetical protein